MELAVCSGSSLSVLASRSMKCVVTILEQLVPISGGGTPRTWHIVQALVRRGHEVHVAAAYGVDRASAMRELGCTGILALPHVSRLDRRKMLKYLFVYPWNVMRVALCIWRAKPDVAVSHNTVAGLGALLAKRLSPRTVTVLDLTDLLFEYLESYRQRWMRPVLALGRALERYTLQRSDRIVTISKAMRDILVREYGVSAAKVEMVHDGVDCTIFHPKDTGSLRDQVSPWAQHVCILHGVIDPQDGPEVLVEAVPKVLSRFPHTAFWWVGDGAAVPHLMSRAQELQLTDHMFFSGWVTQAQVSEYINASDLGIVVLPDVLSARGRVTLKEFEYWACGRAAVLPRLPALCEIIPEGEASLFFTPGAAEDLADKICTLLDNDQQREEMGRKGRQMVLERFDWTALSDRLAQLCESYVTAETRSQRRSVE
jgi:glycosyltransferase involved in cell wall biosynthesis